MSQLKPGREAEYNQDGSPRVKHTQTDNRSHSPEPHVDVVSVHPQDTAPILPTALFKMKTTSHINTQKRIITTKSTRSYLAKVNQNIPNSQKVMLNNDLIMKV